MKVAEKYKQTELGSTPRDWSIVEFQEVMNGFSSGQTPYRAKPEFYKGDIPWITSGELNYNIITDTKEKITIEGVQDALLKTIPVGTFLFAITGLEAAGTRGSCAITGIKATTNQSCMALYPKKGLLTTPYLYHFYVRYGNELAFKYCQGTKQQSYTGGIAKKLPIIIPPTIIEQTAIATALTDADALISSLEKLIAKKRNIKQGAMQILLQPEEGWEVKRLGEVAEIQSGKRLPLGKSLIDSETPYPYLRIVDMLNGGISSAYIKYVPEDVYPIIKNYRIFTNEIYISVAGTLGLIGRVPVSFDGANLTENANKITEIKCNIDYLLFVLKSDLIQNKIEAEKTLGAQPKLALTRIRTFEIPLPSLKEQITIATILSDMDAEISALETKWEKYRKVKLGMMQNLLTGKIRLV